MLYLTPIAAVLVTMVVGAMIFSLIGYDGIGAVREIFLTPLTQSAANGRTWRSRRRR